MNYPTWMYRSSFSEERKRQHEDRVCKLCATIAIAFTIGMFFVWKVLSTPLAEHQSYRPCEVKTYE